MTSARAVPLLLALVLTPLPGPDGGPSGSPAASGPAASASRPRAEGREMLRSVCHWLWNRQAADGGWHSETHGLLRSGQALTPFILQTLLSAPADLAEAPAGAVERALDFIRKRSSADGSLGFADPAFAEYPNYATAYALRCLVRAGRPGDQELIARMRAHLVREQYPGANGEGADPPAAGGWGFGGIRPAGSPGHLDLSHTRKVLEALREAGMEDEAMYARARAFLRRLQNFDGGFYFSPVVTDANKAGPDGERPGSFRSYATATCDGVLSLLAAGVPQTDARVAAAERWLAEHPRLDYPEGVQPGEPMRWGEALHYYHLAVRCEVSAALGLSGRWREEAVRLLALRRRPDGSFANPNHLMKEDDPLLATALAAIALIHAAR